MESAFNHLKIFSNLILLSVKIPLLIHTYLMKKIEKMQFPTKNQVISTLHGPKRSISIKFKYKLKLLSDLKIFYLSQFIISPFVPLR